MTTNQNIRPHVQTADTHGLRLRESISMFLRARRNQLLPLALPAGPLSLFISVNLMRMFLWMAFTAPPPLVQEVATIVQNFPAIPQELAVGSAVVPLVNRSQRAYHRCLCVGARLPPRCRLCTITCCSQQSSIGPSLHRSSKHLLSNAAVLKSQRFVSSTHTAMFHRQLAVSSMMIATVTFQTSLLACP